MSQKAERCRYGHERTPDNVAPNGDCRQCARKRASSWKKDQPFPCGHERTPENTRYRSDGRAFGCGICPPKRRAVRAKTWASDEPRTCRRCGVEKPISEYYLLTKPKSGHKYPAATCIACYQERHRQYHRQLSPEQRARASRLRQLREHNLTELELVALEDRAAGRCEICGESESRPHADGVLRNLALDHDHATGVVRGFLCVMCNTKLGWLEKVGVDVVLAYLRRVT